MKIKFSSFIWVVGIFILFVIGCRVPDFLSKGNSSSTNSNEAKNVSTEPDKSSENNNSQNISALCKNAYYPVGQNVERKYSINYPKNLYPTQEYTEKYTDFKNNNFVAKTDFKEVSTTINWVCTAEGLLATQYGNSIDMKSGSSAKIDTLNSNGVSFPSESRWNTGEKWTAGYDVTETIKNPSGQTTGEGSGKVSQDGEVIGTEEITVPAGKFQAVKVKVKTVLDLTIKVNGISVPTKVPLDTIAWFAKDVGMVKSETGLGGMGNATTELLSYVGTK